MKFIDADKLIEFIKSDLMFSRGTAFMKDTILSFIKANSIEVKQIKPKGIVEINDEIMEREYENYLDAIYIHKADVKTSNNSHNIEKELNVGKSCVNCGQIKDERCRGRWTNVCENWTPKADKVEGEK